MNLVPSPCEQPFVLLDLYQQRALVYAYTDGWRIDKTAAWLLQFGYLYATEDVFLRQPKLTDAAQVLVNQPYIFTSRIFAHCHFRYRVEFDEIEILHISPLSRWVR